MPIIEDTPDTPPDPAPRPVLVAKPSYQGVMVDTRYTPATSLLTHVVGSSWTVNYYSQVLDSDNTTGGQNQDMSAIYQQYKLIQYMELKVTTPLAQVQDTTTKAFSLTGQATIYPCGLIPNEGDMFIADVGDGREGVFRITQSDMRSIYKDAAYVVDYVLINYSTPEQVADLTSKVVEKLTYVADFLEHGQNPLIGDSDFVALGKLNVYFDEISSEYFRRFLSREYSTLIVPGQDAAMYDPFLTHAVLKAFDSDSGVHFKRIRELNVGQDDNFLSSTVWDALLQKKRSRMKGVARYTGLVSARLFNSDAMMESVRYSGVNYVVYPIDPEQSEDYIRTPHFAKPISDKKITLSPTRLRAFIDLITIPELDGLPARDVIGINPMIVDGPYVFSEAFYNRWTVGQSGLELTVQNYLDGKALNQAVLINLAETYASWPLLDQFYQVPVLLMMIRAAIRRL